MFSPGRDYAQYATTSPILSHPPPPHIKECFKASSGHTGYDATKSPNLRSIITALIYFLLI